MTNVRTSAPRRGTPTRTRRWNRVLHGTWALLVTGLWACDGDGGTLPDNLREGQIGEVEVTLEVPLFLGSGTLEQTLTWGSSGEWSLQEDIIYRGLVGDDTFLRSPGDPSPLAAGYASFIALVNEVDGLELFIPELSSEPDTLPDECGNHRTRITLTIRDQPRRRETTWIRCADGSLSSLSPVDAGPDVAASRVVNAAIRVRDGTLGPGFLSIYHGSIPFGTLDRGADSNASLTAPLYINDASAWEAFWLDHSGGQPLPTVDFESEMVLVAAVGVREEAGDSVEVRRIVPVDQGTLTFVVERVPGDFCSPAARAHVPFHIVVAPRTDEPHRFGDVQVEQVSCGG